ncbi:hypothetical protein [Pseudonocardia hydrocarbonoxydans]|uniref:hypothetical protein n=1 Tax=Pseudonocardia hydrocarbonoxydans TaxID=76726 RepID=UPI001142FDEB
MRAEPRARMVCLRTPGVRTPGVRTAGVRPSGMRARACGAGGGARHPRVKIASTPTRRPSSTRSGAPAGGRGGRTLPPSPPEPPGGGGGPAMADIAYVLLLIGGFLMLALTLRGLERW